MQSINLDDAEFYGTVSRPAVEPPRTRAECSPCGSPPAGRFEGIKTFGGKVFRVFKCRCGTTRR